MPAIASLEDLKAAQKEGLGINIYKPLADSWTIFDNSGDVPKMVAFEESGKIEILDPDLFNNLLKYRGDQ